LAELRKEGTYQRLHSIGKQVRQGLEEICQEHGIAVQSCGENVLFDVFFSADPVRNYRDGLASDSQMMNRFNAGLLGQGVLKAWPQKFYPSLAHTDQDIELTLAAFKTVVPTLLK
jgi:glutamate-1-semialdehyde 2,1-aminomutase